MHLPYSSLIRVMIFYLLIFMVSTAILVIAMPYPYQNLISNQTPTGDTLTPITRNTERVDGHLYHVSKVDSLFKILEEE